MRDVDFSCKVTVTDLYCLYFEELVSNVVYADLEMLCCGFNFHFEFVQRYVVYR